MREVVFCKDCHVLLRTQGVVCDTCLQDFLYNNPTDDDYVEDLTP